MLMTNINVTEIIFASYRAICQTHMQNSTFCFFSLWRLCSSSVYCHSSVTTAGWSAKTGLPQVSVFNYSNNQDQFPKLQQLYSTASFDGYGLERRWLTVLIICVFTSYHQELFTLNLGSNIVLYYTVLYNINQIQFPPSPEAFRAPVFRNGPDKNGFSLGIGKNIKQVYGDQVKYWLLPIFTRYG